MSTRCSPSSSCERSASATARWRLPKSMPSANPAVGSRAISAGGRPLPVASRPLFSRSTTTPSACSSETMLETVERDRPVQRAMSARLATPRVCSAFTTFSRFDSRSEPSAPGCSPLTGSASLWSPEDLSRLRHKFSVLSRSFVLIRRNGWIGGGASWYVMRVAVAASRSSDAAPAGIEALIARYDPAVIDVPEGRALVRLRVRGGEDWDARIEGDRVRLEPAREGEKPDAAIAADPPTWMSAAPEPGRLRFERVRTPAGRVSILSAGAGPDVLLCLHGLGGTKASFLPTVAALADRYRVVAMDFPGFGDSDKPIGAPYDSEWFARSAFDTLDALGVDAAHVVGNSMGGRVAIEAGPLGRPRVRSRALLSPARAWRRDRRWAPVVRLLRPELGLLQVTPRSVTDRIVRMLVPGGNHGWAAAGVDEFLRAYLTPRGRAAFYAAARNIYLDEPHGDDGFWARLGGLSTDALFVWGRHDTLVPIAFMKHVERALPAARHVELDCGHVPQLERPRQTHAAMREFMRER